VDPLLQKRLRRLRLTAITVAAAVALYALAGFVIAPPLLRSWIETRGSAFLGRTLRLERLRLNPFTLSATADGLDLRDADGTPLLRWDRLFVDLQAASLLRREWRLRAVDLEGASARLVLLPDGRLNVADLADRLAPAAGPAAPPAAPTAVRIGHLRLAGATVNFVDRSIETPFTTTLGPVRIDVRDLTTHEDSSAPFTFAGRTESGETFWWQGGLSLAPLRCGGRFVLEGIDLTKYHPYYGGTVPFEIRAGTGDLSAGYRFEWSPVRHVLRIEEGSATARDLRLAEPGREEIAFAAPATEVRGAGIDLLTGEVRVASLASRGGHVLLRQYPDGSINLVNMVLPFYQAPAGAPAAPGAPAPSSSPPAATPAPPAGPAPLVRLDEVAFADYTVEAEDQALPRPVRVVLDQVALALREVDNRPATTSRGTLDVRWNGDGTLHAEGELSLMTFVADLTLKADRLDLSPLSPYLEPFLDLRLTSGLLSGEGRARANLENLDRPEFSWSGDLRLDRVATVDGPQGGPFFAWRTFSLNGIEYDLRRDRLRLREAALVRPEVRLAIAPDGGTNVGAVLRWAAPAAEEDGEAGDGGAATSDTAAAPSTAAPPGAPADAGLVTVGRFALRGGLVRLVDSGVTPPLTLSLTDIEGSVAGLSSRPGMRARAGVTAKFEGLAPVSLAGDVDPLGADVYTDLALAVRGADLAPFSPWAGRYIGYTLQKGKLDLDMRYRLEERRLEGTNLLTADQLTLGDKTDSPEATKLPVRLGLALLRDRHGVIHLDVPVAGSLDDPRFRLGRVILRAIANVFGKLVTAPFAMLARAFAGRDDVDLSVVEFEPGAVAVGVDAAARLDTLATALYERPGLRLSIAGSADEPIDAPGLRRARLEALVRAAKWRSLGRREREETAPDAVVVAPDERPKHLKAAWRALRETLPDDASEKPETPEAMDAWILERIAITPEDLSRLAADRAAAVRDRLATGGRIDVARLFIADSGAGAARGALVILEMQ